jgi:hypothetical protein
MMWDRLFLSKQPLYPKILWFLLILPTVYLGMLIYCFVVFEGRERRIAGQRIVSS